MEQTYRLALKYYNDYVGQYNGGMSKYMEKLQQQEEERVSKQVDAIMKLMIF